MKAIVLTCDRYRAITEHMMLKYEQVWPDHPFEFRIPYQDLEGKNTARAEFIQSKGSTPAEIPDMILDLISDLHDDDWLYWCLDDKYPIQLVIDKIEGLMRFAQSSPDVSGLLFCRTRFLKDRPDLALSSGRITTPEDESLLERKGWHQIWIHQLLRAKVLRYFFANMPRNITTAKSMDPLKDSMPKPEEFRIFVTEANYAVFGESTHRGRITDNCLASLKETGVAVPEWFEQSNGESIIVGELVQVARETYLRRLSNALGFGQRKSQL